MRNRRLLYPPRFNKSLRVTAVRAASRTRRRCKLVCFAVAFNLLIWPVPRVTLSPLANPTAAVAASLASAVNEVRDAPTIVLPVGPVLVPIPVLPFWPFQVATPVARDLSMAERTSRVAAVRISPNKVVGYLGDSITFVAMGTDADGGPAQGAKFTFESSDVTKLTIDEAGRATLLDSGLVAVTARAGSASVTAPVLIRPTRRPLQTDDQWRLDQDSLVSDAGQPSDDGRRGILASLAKGFARLAPTAYAQGGGQGADYGNAAPYGQVGTPPFAALEETRLGPVMPQTIRRPTTTTSASGTAATLATN